MSELNIDSLRMTEFPIGDDLSFYFKVLGRAPFYRETLFAERSPKPTNEGRFLGE